MENKAFLVAAQAIPGRPYLVGVFSSGSLSCAEGFIFYGKASALSQQVSLQEGEWMWDSEGFYLMGMGKAESVLDWQKVGGDLCIQCMKKEPVNVMVDGLSAEAVRGMLYGFTLRQWRFEKYHTSARPLPTIKGKDTVFITSHDLQSQIKEDGAVVGSVHWARELANEPGNVIFPESFVQRVQELSDLGIEVSSLSQSELESQGFWTLLGVGQGSSKPPTLAVLSWKGAEEDQAPIVLVGKGITFDTGGYSIKPRTGMMGMQFDKAGACIVSGVVRALALRKAKINVVALCALAENMVSGNAQRPGDVVQSLSGQTVEILDTDAEGRLVLADALWYGQKTYKPQIILDVATLTGSIRVALGEVYAGLFCNDDALTQELMKAGKEVGENLWPMPLHENYDKHLNSNIADMQNISDGGGAGSSVAAHFLKRFIVPGTLWAHLDVAAVEDLKQDTYWCPKGSSAFGVRLLDRWIRKYEA